MIELQPGGRVGEMTSVISSSVQGVPDRMRQIETVGRFLRQGKVAQRIGGMYFAGWTVIVLVLAIFLVPQSGFFTFALCVVWGIGLFGVVYLAATYWQSRIHAVMDYPTIHTESDHLVRGQQMTIRYRHLFKQDTVIETLRFQLVLQEWVRYQQGTSTSTETREIVMAEDWHDQLIVQAGVPYEREIHLQVPDNAMHSFNASDNKLTWMLKLEVDLPGWLDFRETYGLVVLSEGSDVR